MIFRGIFSKRRKVVQILVVVLVLGLALGAGKIFSARFASKAETNTPAWQKTEDLINQGKIAKREKILELTFNYNSASQPSLNLTGSQIKNGYAPKYQDLPDSYSLQVSDSSTKVISSIKFKIPKEILIDDDKNTGSQILDNVNFALTIPWDERIAKITVSDLKDQRVLEKERGKNLSVTEEQVKSRPNSRTINGDQLLKNKQSKSIFKNAVASRGDQYFDLTFISFGYTDFNQFHSDANRYSSRLLTVEPFKTRASQIRFHYVDNVADLGDWSKPIQIINDAGIPYDTIGVIVANNAGPCNFGLSPLSEYYACRTVTTKDEAINIHELGHAFGNLNDEYFSYFSENPVTLDNQVHAVTCYAGNPPALEWQNKVGLKDYSLGCGGATNWYRSAPYSIMLRVDSYPTFSFFDTVSQEQLKRKLDFYALPFFDLTKPTINITYPSSGQTISNDIEITSNSSDNRGVARVQLWIDGKLYQTQYQSPYKFTWATIDESDGSHSIQLKAFDANGNMGVSSVKKITLQKQFFPDVSTTDPFYNYIKALYKKGITVGAPCPTGYPSDRTCYYLNANTTRQETAAFLTRSANLAINYQTGPFGDFADVPPANPFYFDINTLYTYGVTNGCNTTSFPYSYCPTNNTTRAQLAVFLTKAAKMSLYAGTEQPFSDVPTTHPQYKEIMTVYKTGIIDACQASPLKYCPDNPVLRKEMAKFLVNTFKIPL